MGYGYDSIRDDKHDLGLSTSFFVCGFGKRLENSEELIWPVSSGLKLIRAGQKKLKIHSGGF